MATIDYRAPRARWRVRWTPEGSKSAREKYFKTKEECVAFVAVHGLKRSSGANGRRRTAAQVRDFILANSVVRTSGCREWTRPLTNDGYPRLTWLSDEGYMIRGAHRLSHHLFVAPVPNDHLLAVDHLCRNRACVNPEHLELVSQRENIMRSPIAPGALNASKTHCVQGHPYDEENTYVYTFKTRRTTTRICKTCAAEHHRRYRLARMGGAA